MSKQPYQMDQLEWIEHQRQQTLLKIRGSQQNIQKGISSLTSAPSHTDESPAGRLLTMFERGMMIYRGIRFGMRIGSSLIGAFGFGSRKRRR